MAKQQEQAEFGDLREREPPRTDANGLPNPEYYRYRFSELSNHTFAVMRGEIENPRGFDAKKAFDILVKECELCGIDPKHLMDARSDSEKALDAASQLAVNIESMFEQSEEILVAIESTMNKVDRMGEEEIDERLKPLFESAGLPPPKSSKDALGKVRTILERVRRIRHRATHPVPKVSGIDTIRGVPKHTHHKTILESVWLARYMVYVMRSTIAGRKGKDRILNIGMHHIKIIIDAWQAENSVNFNPGTRNKPGSIAKDKARYHCDGVIEFAPPEHGKTTVCTGWAIKHISYNHDAQGVWLHDRANNAEENVEMVKRAFMPDNAVGRRNLSLHPGIELSKNGNGRGHLQLKLDSPPKGPTMYGTGVFSSALGSDLSFQIIDDVVPASDIHEESVRKRRVSVISTTWKGRLRGENSFRFIVGTMQHPQDAMARLYDSSRRTSNPLPYITRAQRVKAYSVGSRVRIKALWPEGVSEKKLLTHYHEINDKVLWDRNYECNSKSDSSRLIRTLRYYDPESVEHRVFMQTSRGHLSIDPAFTNRSYSDKAGVIIGAHSSVSGYRYENGVKVFDTEDQLRIVYAEQVPGSGAKEYGELVSRVVGVAKSINCPIDLIHVEINNAGIAVVEELEERYDITCEKHTTGNKSKELRLRNVMSMIDNSQKDCDACVLFPGKALRDENGDRKLDETGEPIIVKDHEMQWVYDQFIDFGFTKDDHVLDATTQLCKFMSVFISPGRGVVSKSVQLENFNQSRVVRTKKMVLKQMFKKDNGEDEETEYIEKTWGNRRY